MPYPPRHATSRLLLSTLIAGLMLSGCNRSDNDSAQNDDHDHDHPHVETAGRLAIADAQAPRLRVVNLDDAQTLDTFTLAYPATALYASPERRYAVVIQRNDDQVSFIDGGLWQEDHGDHLHDYQEAPKRLSFGLSARRPTHYEAHGALAALFFDGSAEPSLPAEIRVFSEASLGDARELAVLNLPVNMHGTAEPRGDHLLTTHRDADAATTLPDRVDLYRRQGVTYQFVERFEEHCPGLHGSYSNEGHTAFGCTDGVLVVSQQGEQFTARKIGHPTDMPENARIGTLAGHHALNVFAGLASPGHLFVVDPDNATLTPVNWAEGRTRRAHGFDAHGEHFLMLDDQGDLHLIETATWTVRARLRAIDVMPAAAPWPSLSFSQRDAIAHVSDPEGRAIVEINLETAQISRRLPLDFKPLALTWLGIGEHAH